MRGAPEVLFLDFDGVICDSLEECLRSSWFAANGIAVGPDVPPDPPVDGDYRARFRACRPYIRSGEDYLVVHEWAAAGRVPADQAEFDRSLAAKGEAAMARAKQALYAVREDLLSRHRSLWLSWNPLYPGMAHALRGPASRSDCLILSTKKAAFIAEILRAEGLDWPLSRIHTTGPRAKLDMVAELAGPRPALLLDDQIEHLDFGHPTCRCVLALWGYVTPATAAAAADRLDLAAGLDLLRTFPGPRRPA